MHVPQPAWKEILKGYDLGGIIRTLPPGSTAGVLDQGSKGTLIPSRGRLRKWGRASLWVCPSCEPNAAQAAPIVPGWGLKGHQI